LLFSKGKGKKGKATPASEKGTRGISLLREKALKQTLKMRGREGEGRGKLLSSKGPEGKRSSPDFRILATFREKKKRGNMQ